MNFDTVDRRKEYNGIEWIPSRNVLPAKSTVASLPKCCRNSEGTAGGLGAGHIPANLLTSPSPLGYGIENNYGPCSHETSIKFQNYCSSDKSRPMCSICGIGVESLASRGCLGSRFVISIVLQYERTTGLLEPIRDCNTTFDR